VVLPAGALGKGSHANSQLFAASSPIAGRCEQRDDEVASAVASQVTYALQLLEASGREAEALNLEHRKIDLVPGPATTEGLGGSLTLTIGRHQQAQMFEAWLPELGQRSCISRKALEVSWVPGLEGVRVVVCGTNPLYVDSQVVPKGSAANLKVGSEVAFTYEQKVLLRFRLVVSSGVVVGSASTKAPSSASGGPVAMTTGSSSALLSAWSTERTMPLQADGTEASVLAARLPDVSSVADAVEGLNARRLVSPQHGYCVVYSAAKAAYFLLFQPGMQELALSQLGLDVRDVPASCGRSPAHGRSPVTTPVKASSMSPTKAGTPLRSPTKGRVRIDETPVEQRHYRRSPSPRDTRDATKTERIPASWVLRVIHAEGMSSEHLSSLPLEQRDIELRNGVTAVGRHHQGDLFEHWLPDDSVRNCISRNHMEVSVNGKDIVVTNLSTNWLCLEREPVARHKTRSLERGHVLSFAREEQNSRGESSLFHFLMLQVVPVESSRGSANLFAAESSPSAARTTSLSARSPMRRRATLAPSFCEAAIDETRTAARSSDTRAAAQLFQQVPSETVSPSKPSCIATRADSPPRCERYAIGTTSMGSPKVELSPKLDFSSKLRSKLGNIEADLAQPPVPDGASVEAPPISLQLQGVGATSVLPSQRCLGPLEIGRRSYLVGRGRQPELHNAAISEELLPYMNRDDFCICYEAGDFWLLVMCDTPLWHEPSGKSPARLKPNELVKLTSGDNILLGYTYSGDASCPGEALLRWHFTLAEAQKERWRGDETLGKEPHAAAWFQNSSKMSVA